MQNYFPKKLFTENFPFRLSFTRNFLFPDENYAKLSLALCRVCKTAVFMSSAIFRTADCV